MKKSGKFLKMKREEKGSSLEEVSSRTKISKQFIIALEEDESSVFPSATYRNGFLKTYCNLLGLDADEFTQDTKELYLPQNIHVPIAKRRKSKTGFLISIFIVLVLFYYFQGVRKPAGQQSRGGVHSRLQPLEEKNLKMEINAPTWVRMTSKGKVVLEGTLSPGRYQWPLNDELLVRIGYVNGTEIFFGNQPIDIKKEARMGIGEVYFSRKDTRAVEIVVRKPEFILRPLEEPSNGH